MRRKIARRSYFDVPVEGLANPVFNDVVLTSSWRTAGEWRWRRPAHINIHETEAVLRLLQSQAKERPRTRFSVRVDSHVALSALAKGRSPSYGLRPVLGRAAMTMHHIAGCLYPAFLFAPTRMNPSDCPTRNAKYPEACVNSFSEGLDFEECLRLSEVNKLRRFASNWVRLVFLLLKTKLPWKNHRDGQSWRFTHYSPSTLPASPGPATSGHFADLDFDMSLGFPGEGPAYNHLAIIFHTLFGFWFCPAASLSVGFALALLPGWDSCLSTGHWGFML